MSLVWAKRVGMIAVAPTKPPRDAKSIFVSSSRLVPLFETASCFRGLKRANSKRIAKKLVQNLTKNAFWPTPMRDPSHVSCLVSVLRDRTEAGRSASARSATAHRAVQAPARSLHLGSAEN